MHSIKPKKQGEIVSKPHKTLLVIGHVWPEPTASAAGRHMLSLIKMFQLEQYRVHFWCGAKVNENPEELSPLGIETAFIELNSDSFDKSIAQLMPDIVMFDRFMTEEQFGWRVAKNCPQALRLLDTEDLHCLRHARHEALKKAVDLEQVLMTSEMSKREIASIYRSDATLVLSRAEIPLLENTFNLPRQLLIHSPFMLELVERQHKSFDERKHFVSIGNFLHAPNWDAVLRLRESIWPLIRKKLPKAEMHVYGAYAANKAYALDNKKLGFRILGRAEDAHEVLENARLCLAPLRFGAGLKGKFTDAMQVGTPSITTTIGVEGMVSESSNVVDWPGYVAESDTDFADLSVDLYQNKTLWHEKQKLGDELLKSQFDAVTNRAKLMTSIDQILSNLSQYRQENFYGQMLNHHHHKSSEYMSRWIQSKNEVLRLKKEND
jgi:glycosyltransferase involved in cell wall biosynthesis